jgi:acyl carrier protein
MDEIAEATDYILDDRFSYETIKVQLKTLSGMIARNGIERIDLLKVNVEKSELDLLHGIRDPDWSKIEQLVIKVDVPENLEPIVALIDSHGYESAVSQDRLLQGTPINTVYAIRPSANRRLTTDDQAGRHRHPMPVLGQPFISADELKKFLGTKIPQYMVPSKFIFVERLARTPSGKIDRQALTMLNKSDGRDRPRSAKPSVGIEKELAQIWLKLLDIEDVGSNDNFFEMGGDSLQVAVFIAAIREKYQVRMSFRTFFERPTIAGLVSIIEDSQKDDAGQEKGHEDRDLKDKLRKLERD